VLGFVVCRTEIAEQSMAALKVVETQMCSKIALLAAARVGQLCR
jgi:hypothetical protein